MQNIKRIIKQKPTIIVTALVIIILAGTVAWLLAGRHTNPGNQQVNIVKTEVGKLMILPKDEQPTLATVEDKTKLTDKFLVANAENGDRVLIYTKKQLVIIYRPSVNKIVAVGSVTVDPALAEAKGATLTVLDSTNNPAKEQKIINEVRAAYPDIKVTDGGKSNKQNFTYTIVIDNTDQKDNLLLSLVDLVSGKRGIQPPSENKASTDFLIIVGQD